MSPTGAWLPSSRWLADRHAGGCVLAVTHGGVLDALYRHVTRMPLEQPRDFPVYNASINRVRRDPGGWILESWGDISHLTGRRADHRQCRP